MKVNTEEKTGVKIVYAVTDDGNVFVWPPYGYEEGYYITDSSTITKDKIIKSGDSEVVIAKKPTTITTDKDGNLINRIPLNGDNSGEDKPATKIKLTKPKITGSYVYNGNTQTVTLSVFDSNTMAVSGNTRKDAGSQAVTVSLKDTSKYEWSDGTTSAVVLNWTVAKKSVSVSWSNLNFEHDGKNHIPTASVSGIYEGNNVALNITGAASAEGEHTATATLTGSSAENYELTNTTTKFTIVKTTVNVSTLTITLSGTSFTYTGAEIKPTVTIKNGATTLNAGTDYTLSYGNNKNAGTATITIKGNGKYVGTTTKNFTIERAKTAMATASNKSYTGSAQTGVTGTHVDLSGTTSATNVGTYTATAIPKANYAWSDGTTTAKTLTWKITEKASSSLTVTLEKETYTYDGTAKEPAVTVKDGSTTLTLNTHYTVSYSNNVNAGTATATITMNGNYSGTITKNFTIQKGTMSGNVTIKGTAKYGETLMVDTQNIVPNNSTSYSYIWWYSPSASATLGTKIDDSTNSNTYKIGDGLIDKYIGVTVTATNENYEEKTFTDITDTTENGEGKVIRISITKPTKTSKTYSYNGKNQTLELNNYDSSLMSITNNSSTNAGNFTAVISLKNNNYMWSDSTTSELNINWSIEKIANTLSVTAINNLKTTGGDLALVTASNAQGTVYYSIGTALTSSNYSSAGSTAIPTARTAGTYTVYYYTPGNTNYLEKNGNVQVTVVATTYTVTYNANGGNNAPANQSKILGTNLVLSSTAPTRSGYDFVSWNTKSDGTGTSYNAGGTYTQDAPLTLYAIWKIKTVALSDTLYIGALSSYNNEPAATQTKTLELDLTDVKTLSFNTSGKWGYRNDIKATVSLIVNGTEYKKENIADGADNPVIHSFDWDVSSITGSATLQLYGYAKGGPAYYYGGKKFPAWQSNVGPLSVTDIVLNY